MVEGALSLDDLNNRLELELESEQYDSVGGFIIQYLDRLPEVGDEFTTEDGIRMVVEQMEKNRVQLVHVYLPEAKDEEPESEDEEDFADELKEKHEKKHA